MNKRFTKKHSSIATTLKQKPTPHSEPFDPFQFDDDDDDNNDYKQEGQQQDLSFLTSTTVSSHQDDSHDNDTSLDKSRDSISITNKSSAYFEFDPQFDSVKRKKQQHQQTQQQQTQQLLQKTPSAKNTNVDCSIYSELFQIAKNEENTTPSLKQSTLSFRDDVSSIVGKATMPPTTTTTTTKTSFNFSSATNDILPSKNISKSTSGITKHVTLPVFMNYHETMSCIYNESNHVPTECQIEGTISLIPNKFIKGQSFYMSLKDVHNHIGQIDMSNEELVRQVSTNHRLNTDEFVKAHHEEYGCRGVYQVDIPRNLTHLNHNSQPIEIMKLKGSDFLRPIPLLVNCKVRLSGDYCRVGIKVRSNPSNKRNIKNVSILMAVPPDASGETMKMSLRGGVWDPMRRMIVWSFPVMKNGETIDFQLQFEYCASPSGAACDELPRFPILVRCDAEQTQLSDVEIQVGGGRYYDANGVGHRVVGGVTPFKLNLSKSYRLFHRKI